jgi:hypothetical protein
MHNTAHIVLEDVLVACNTINLLGDQTAANLENRRPIDLTEQEKDELNRAFTLMRQTLDCVHPLINFDSVALRSAG